MSGCNVPDENTNKFVPGLNSYYDMGKSTSFNLASQLDAGLMSVSDFCKLQTITIPPPSITLTSNNCNTTIKGGIIGIISGDTYIKVDSSVDIKQNEDGSAPSTYENIPLKIHGNTYGVRFSLDIDRLSSYLIRNGRLILKGTVGKVGEIGDKGPPGIDYVLSGPKGNDGLPGTTPPINLIVQNEDIDVVNVGSTGITDIQPVINQDGTYDLVITRQPIGDSEVSTNRINISGVETNWAVVVSGPGTNRQVYYLDLDPMVTTVYNRATTYAELIKKGYEDAVVFWIKTMSDLFDSQKDALCCALDRCRSRIKNDSLRRHFELTSATAKPDYKTIIKTRRDDPEILTSTGILKELYPDGDFCKDPLPKCNFGDAIFTRITQNVNCVDNLYIEGTIKYDFFEKDISDELALTSDVGQVIPSTVTKDELLAGITIEYNCGASYIDVTSSGKCVNSDRIILPDIPDIVCEFGEGSIVLEPPGTTPSFTLGKWQFTEINYIPQISGSRAYDQDNIPTTPEPYGAMWSVLDNGYGLKAVFTDSQNCGGLNFGTQSGRATVNIVATKKEFIIIDWDGLGEAQAPEFELMTLKIDGVLLGDAHAPGGNLGCAMGPIVSNNLYPNGYELDVGNHTIEIEVNTNDSLYHVGAYYQFRLTKSDSNSGCVPGKRYTGTIKYGSLSSDLGPFSIVANVGEVIPNTATRDQLLSGLAVEFDCAATILEIKSTGVCDSSDVLQIPPPPPSIQKVEKFTANVVKENVQTYDEVILTLNYTDHVGLPSNAASLELPKGMYKVKIVDTDLFINGKYNALVRILTTKGLSVRSMDFVNKGSFDFVDESRVAYINNTIIVDHDGGLLKAYLLGSNDINGSGSVILSVTPMRITLNPNQLLSLKSQIKNNIVRVKNIEVDISMDGVNTGIQTSFEFNGTILVPIKNI